MAGYCSTARAVRAGRRSPAVLRASRAVAPRRFIRRRPSDTDRPPPAGRNRPCETDRGQPDADSRPGPCRRLATEHRRPVAHRPSRIGRRATGRACRVSSAAHRRRSAARISSPRDRGSADNRTHRPPPQPIGCHRRSDRSSQPISRDRFPPSIARPPSPHRARRRRRVRGRPARHPAAARIRAQAARLAPTPTEADFRAAHAHRTHGCAGRARTAPRPRARSRRQARTRTRTSRCARR